MAVWLVTGAARGFGRELVRQALAEGDAVVATARDPGRFDLGRHERLFTLAHDVTDERRATEVVDAALARFGRIDVVVNNAGAGLLGAVEETTDEQARAVFETNVFGLLAVTRAVLPVLRRQRAGHLVALSSMGGFSSGAGFGPARGEQGRGEQVRGGGVARGVGRGVGAVRDPGDHRRTRRVRDRLRTRVRANRTHHRLRAAQV